MTKTEVGGSNERRASFYAQSPDIAVIAAQSASFPEGCPQDAAIGLELPQSAVNPTTGNAIAIPP